MPPWSRICGRRGRSSSARCTPPNTPISISLPPTRNPWDLARTPGGSSAGSGAAIASGTVPLALGTQTAGSVNRPAAYTGVGAFKPSTLAIGGAGVVPLAPSFDTVGAFGGSAQDAALCAAGYAADHLGLRAPAPVQPRIVLLGDPMVSARTRARHRGPHRRAGRDAGRRRAGGAPGDRRRCRWKPCWRPIAGSCWRSLAAPMRGCRATCSPRASPPISRPGWRSAMPTTRPGCAPWPASARAFWAGFGAEDLLLLPAAPDVAPDAATTGDPSFVIPLTVLGGPIATLRAGLDTGMPVGALLSGAPGADARLAGFLLSDLGTRLDL